MRTLKENVLLASSIIEVRVGCLIALTVNGCDDKSTQGLEKFKSQPQISAPEDYLECAGIVNQYIATKKAWPEADYNVSFDGLDRDTGHQVFRISHIESYRQPIGVGGDDYSIFVHADCTSMTIKGEYKQQ